ncbi:TIM barrel protein [Bacillus sp. BRMEA1]|uniref:sugar phosphate isomerase/epimerase family protein n=1 Tax=Neobacillus endophyticus TaxID=2738405 RepID=UPI0015662FA5|nr:TIM barrel protein [Neobacillus endophyticus]NRD77170.1 TIM barrel protein [Neobacillus endophyticus]
MAKIMRDQITGMNFHYMHYPFEYFLDSMVRYGFKNIELWGASPHFYVEDMSLSDIRRVKKEITRRELSVVCFTPEQCVYPINLAAKENQIREKSIQYFIKSAEAAKELEAPMLLVTPGWGYENENRDEAWKRTRDSLDQLTRAAADLDLTLVFEPLTRVESNLVNDAHALKAMLDEVNSPYLKGMIDTIPMALANEDFLDYDRILKKDLVHVHFIDGKPEGHLVWGDGVLPLEKYVEQLSQIGYTGALTLEYTSYQYVQDPDAAIEKTLRSFSTVLEIDSM